MSRADLPWVAAVLVPAAVIGAAYAMLGAEPLAVLIGGFGGALTGLLSVSVYALVQLVQYRRAEVRKLEATEKFLRDQDEPPDRG